MLLFFRFFDVFRGYKKGTPSCNGLKKLFLGLLLSYHFHFVTGFFFILVQLIILCNNSYHSEKFFEIRHTGGYSSSMPISKSIVQFKAMLSRNKYKENRSTRFFYVKPRFLRLSHGFDQKDKKHAKKL